MFEISEFRCTVSLKLFYFAKIAYFYMLLIANEVYVSYIF